MGGNVGINGFGRIGRLVMRSCMKRNINVTVVNDPSLDPEYMAYLLKYDSVHGRFRGDVQSSSDGLCINGKPVFVSKEKDPSKVDWKKGNVQTVIEASGLFTDCLQACKHVEAGAKKVIITAPSKDAPMFVYGVNHDKYTKDMQIASCASCTTNCLAPLCKVVHDKFVIKSGLMTTVHAVTATQKTVDVPTGSKKSARGGRAAFINMIPESTGAAKAIGKVIPDLQGKLTGMAIRVPVANVSLVDLTVLLEKEASMEQILEAVKEAAEGPMKGVLGYTNDEVVSSDFIGSTCSSVYDVKASIGLTKNFIKLISWYDNEWGYSNRVIDFLNFTETKSS